jgi:hypothetical protein
MKLFLFLLLSAICFYVNADSKYFEISGIEVKQSGSNSFVAKQKALSKAMLLAFEKIIETNLKKKALSANSVSLQQIQNCLYDYSIDQEKFSDSVYICRISYRFLKKKVAFLLRSYGITIDFEDEEEKTTKIAVYLEDFLKCAGKMRDMKVDVESFSEERVVFRINKKKLKDFYRLRIRYAQLS